MNQILTSIFFRWVGSVTNQFLWSSGFRTVFTPKDLNLNPPNLRRQTPAVASFASLPCWGEGKQWPEGDQGPERRETPYEKRCYVWKPSNFESHHFSSNIGGELKVLPFFSDLFAEIAVILVCTLCHGFGTLPWHVGMFFGVMSWKHHFQWLPTGTTSVMVRNIPNRHLAFSWCGWSHPPTGMA